MEIGKNSLRGRDSDECDMVFRSGRFIDDVMNRVASAIRGEVREGLF